MAGERVARHFVIDGFLPTELAEELLVYAADRKRGWRTTRVSNLRGGRLKRAVRQSQAAKGGLGPFEPAFTAAIAARTPELCQETGSAPLAAGEADLEIELVAHRDGGFYARHIDTFADPSNSEKRGPRFVSTVYYLHRRKRGFSGGELALYPFIGDAPPVLIEPHHNRLVAFPSIAPHEVLPVRCAGDAPEAARFSINCWLRCPPGGGQ
jgi:SM-20-related protein